MKKKTPEISDAEKQMFRNAVSHVKSYEEKTNNDVAIEVVKNTEKTNTKRVITKPRVNLPAEKSIFYFSDKQPDISGSDVISFSRSGLQHKRFAQLKQGKMQIEATLDLHEHTSDEAIHKTDAFLIHCQHSGLKTVCIIHGKGHFSADNKPVLKNILNNYLRSHPCVLAFHSAKNKHGGTGAMIVMIKSK